jgi:hypothetical protein
VNVSTAWHKKASRLVPKDAAKVGRHANGAVEVGAEATW